MVFAGSLLSKCVDGTWQRGTGTHAYLWIPHLAALSCWLLANFLAPFHNHVPFGLDVTLWVMPLCMAVKGITPIIRRKPGSPPVD